MLINAIFHSLSYVGSHISQASEALLNAILPLKLGSLLSRSELLLSF